MNTAQIKRSDQSKLTLGSLFSGSGGFELGGMLAGIKPIWNSEIEPFPIRVTTKRFPDMRYYGDVCALDGSELEPVDVITFGSPCQDMSNANGFRTGLRGSRSGLFFQAVRIINEMRDGTTKTKPRFIVWENVPGAFTSNKGEDFRIVLEKICKVKDRDARIPRPENGRWADAGLILGNDYSVAWRVLDAQFFGVPQRRRRVFLVADFGGGSAKEILFNSSVCPRGTASRFREWKDFAGSLKDSVRIPSDSQRFPVGLFPLAIENHAMDARFNISPLIPTLTARMGTGGGNVPCIAVPTADITHENPRYRIRRLTPTECGRLQGFPDYWTQGLETENPTNEEIEFWKDVFETHRRVIGTSANPKSVRQIRKWLQHPSTDSVLYKMWGNGVCLPCVYFVMSGLARVSRQASTELESNLAIDADSVGSTNGHSIRYIINGDTLFGRSELRGSDLKYSDKNVAGEGEAKTE